MKNSVKPDSLDKSPKHLSQEARDWWHTISSEYSIDDGPGLLLLQTALEAFDRMRQAQKILKRDGIVIVDRFRQKKQHPATLTERDSKATMISALRQLHLDLEPLRDAPGRPPGK